ncbi:cytochrome P450 [Streptomyces sp. MK5]|uniref:cytochrome P450 family protein n=1 Tax=Streptomyces sp. MK5 TaxID=3064253 RepID=UPI00274163EA|nr:cytochrome P450 [Streptomyces sp. MK5]
MRDTEAIRHNHLTSTRGGQLSTHDQRPYVLDPTGHDIQAEGARLRARGPVTKVMLPGNIPAWSVTSHTALEQLLTDPRVSKDPRRHWPRFIAGEITPQWPLYAWVSVTNMFTAYGSDHRRLRRLVTPAFTAHRTAQLRPQVERIVTRVLDDLPRTAVNGVVDLRQHFAYLIPVQVITQLMGVPEGSMAAGIRTCVDNIFNTALSPQEAADNYHTTYSLLNDLVEHRRRQPGDDLTSYLISAGDSNEALTETEVIDTLLLIIAAGHETTVNLLDNAVFALLTRPDQHNLVRTGKVAWTDVIEESLRVDAPVAHLPLRYAVEDITVAGTTIPKGDAILASYAAAGQDPERHGPTAGVFDATRENKDHVAFGYGVHYCLGAPLARMEAATALPALFERFPSLALARPAGSIEPLSSFISQGHRSLPVTLTRDSDAVPRTTGHRVGRHHGDDADEEGNTSCA